MKKYLIVIAFLSLVINCYSQPVRKTDSYGGITDIRGQKTGWFHVQQLNGHWYFITPEGHAFFSLGATHAVESLYQDELNMFETKYNKSEEAYSNFIVKCFKDWGYNSSGYGPLPGMEKQIPYVKEVWTYGPRSHSAGNKSVNEDIFDPLVQDKLRRQIQKEVKSHVNNPNCIGYVFSDCPHWGVVPVNGISYVDFVRALKSGAPGKTVYLKFLGEKYSNIQVFNSAYKLNVQSFDELAQTDLSQISPKGNEAIAADDDDFLAILADAYFKFTSEEFRKADPNHLLLGDRFMAVGVKQVGQRVPDGVLVAAAKYLDVLSFQPMGGQTMMKDYIDEVNALTGKPVLLADVNTMTSRPTEGQTDTREYETSAGEHTLKFYLNASDSKALIGIHRCTVRDYRPWDTHFYRRGLLKADDTPYPILVDFTRRTNQMVFDKVYTVTRN